MSNKQNDTKQNPTAEVNAAANTALPVDVAAAIAPLTPAPVIAVEDTETNRYRRLFEPPQFSVSDSSAIYTSERSGMKSTKLANVLLIFKGGFAAVPGTIYARQPKSGKAYVELALVGTMQSTAIKPLNEASKAEFLDFKHGIATDYAGWRKAQGITAQAPAKPTTAVEVDGLDMLFAAPTA